MSYQNFITCLGLTRTNQQEGIEQLALFRDLSYLSCSSEASFVWTGMSVTQLFRAHSYSSYLMVFGKAHNEKRILLSDIIFSSTELRPLLRTEVYPSSNKIQKESLFTSAHLEKSFAALAGSHSIMLAGCVVSTDRTQTLVWRRSSGRGRRHLAVHQLVPVAELQGVGESQTGLFPYGAGHGKALTIQATVRTRVVVRHGDVQRPVKAHLAAGDRRARRGLLEGEQRKSRHRSLALLYHVRSGRNIVLVETVEGARVLPHVIRLNLEVGCTRGVRWGGLEVHGPSVSEHFLRLRRQVALLMVAVHLDVLHLDGGLLSRVGHLIQTGRFHVVTGVIVVHECAETRQRSGGCDLGVGQVHAKLYKLGC